MTIDSGEITRHSIPDFRDFVHSIEVREEEFDGTGVIQVALFKSDLDMLRGIKRLVEVN